MRRGFSAALAVAAGCASTAGEPAPAGGAAPVPVVARTVLEAEMARAEDAARQGDGEAAAAALLRAYREGFEPLEAGLRDGDPLAVTRLEYRFGEAIRAARRRPRGAVPAIEALAAEVAGATSAGTPGSAASSTDAEPRR